MAEYLVNGYAYPSISEETLAWWLPRLTWLSAFSYGFTAEGRLVNLADENLVTAANAAGVRPMMVLTPLDAEGRFNDNIAAAVFEDPEAQTNLFDFEYIPRVYAADYVELVARTQRLLSPQGYLTSVALAPKVRADQPGVLYEGHDYAGMGRAADYCLLMTYEWGYTDGGIADQPCAARAGIRPDGDSGREDPHGYEQLWLRLGAAVCAGRVKSRETDQLSGTGAGGILRGAGRMG